MADIIDKEEIDKDTVSPEILEQQFSKKYKLLTEKAISLKKSYVNHLSATKSLRLAVSQSDHSIEVFQLTDSGLNAVCRLSGHPEQLTGLAMSPLPAEGSQLYSCGSDGVKLWDTRAGGSSVLHYHDEEPRPLECVDVSCSGRVVCAGSALLQDDAFLVFWDTRQDKPLGGYWNTHSDDITQVRFHPTEPSCMASGSADGVLNIYDISQPSEDDALSYSIPVASGIERVSWLGGATAAGGGVSGVVGVATGGQQVALCAAASGSVLRTYSRAQLAKGIRRSNSEDCYVVDVFSGTEGVPEVMAGSYGGDGAVRTARLAGARPQPRSLLPSGGSRQTVRCCYYHPQQDILIAAGEAGIISVWGATHGPTDADGDASATHGLTDSAAKLRTNRYQPY